MSRRVLQIISKWPVLMRKAQKFSLFGVQDEIDISRAPAFWRRISAEHPDNIHSDYESTHPSTAGRFVRMENVTKEIRTKEEAGNPLPPNMKSDK